MSYLSSCEPLVLEIGLHGVWRKIKDFLLFLASKKLPWHFYFPSRIPQIENVEVSAKIASVNVVSTFPINRSLSRL